MIALADLDKRWRDRTERWVAPGRLFDPSSFGVEVIPERQARELVCSHHYSGSFPAARLSVGLVRQAPAARELVGVAVFSVPMSQRAIALHSGLEAAAGVELGRFVCLPDVAYNGETWFLTRAFQALRADKPTIGAVVSYADPLERSTLEGELCKPAHAGTIYKASNATFVGRACPRILIVDRAGRVISNRALSKIRKQERGHRYAERQVIDAGADPRRAGEDPRAWLERVLTAPLFRRLRHPGNLTFVFGFDAGARAHAKARSLPYERQAYQEAA